MAVHRIRKWGRLSADGDLVQEYESLRLALDNRQAKEAIVRLDYVRTGMTLLYTPTHEHSWPGERLGLERCDLERLPAGERHYRRVACDGHHGAPCDHVWPASQPYYHCYNCDVTLCSDCRGKHTPTWPEQAELGERYRRTVANET